MGLPGRVWSTLQPICSTDLTREELGVRAEALADTSFKAAVAVPISAGADLVAVLELFRSKPLGDQQRLITSLSAIAAQLGGVIQRKRDEERMRYLANFDALTGLSNRILFYDRLRQALIDAHRHDRLVGVAFIDLDRFKAVNDSLGHEAGDVLLKSVAERLIGCVRQGDTVGSHQR
jgi:PleD family two-component response regulator